MLLNLLVQHPTALGEIIQKTPVWVWALLAGLVWLGASQLHSRQVGLLRAMAMPLAMTAFSVYGLASAFGMGGHALAPLAAWLAAAVGVAAAALWLQPMAARGTEYSAASRSFSVPGSAMPLLLILGIFLTKYFVGVELALQPALARDGAFALQIATLYGVFNGVFAARTLRLWKLVREHAPLAAPATSTPSAHSASA